METISSGLRMAGSALYSAGQAANSAASSAASWLGRNIKWLASSKKPAISRTGAGSGKPTLSGWIKSWTTSSTSTDPTASSITTSVTTQSPPPQISFKEFACHEAVAIALSEHPPSNMPKEAISHLFKAIQHFNSSEQPRLAQTDPAHYKLYKNQAVASTKEAISKCNPEVQADINGILLLLETQFDVLNEQLSQETEESIHPEAILKNTKTTLIKTAQAAFAPKEAKEPAVLLKWQQKQALNRCATLRNQLQSTKFILPTYSNWANSTLTEAERLYSSGNFSLGNQQYDYANSLVNGEEYKDLRNQQKLP